MTRATRPPRKGTETTSRGVMSSSAMIPIAAVAAVAVAAAASRGGFVLLPSGVVRLWKGARGGKGREGGKRKKYW